MWNENVYNYLKETLKGKCLMKKLVSLILVFSFFVVVLSACSETDAYATRTAKFYGEMDKKSFWYKATIIEPGESYRVTQATNGSITTTIEDHDTNSLDKYHLYDGQYIQSLNFPNKCYDTIATKSGIAFRFKDYAPHMFPKTVSSKNETYNDVSYFCETFGVSTKNDGKVDAYNKYYFDGDRLKVIEIIENEKTVLVIEFEGYSNTIPEDIYLKVPEDFKPKNFIEEEEIDYSDFEDDWFGDNPRR